MTRTAYKFHSLKHVFGMFDILLTDGNVCIYFNLCVMFMPHFVGNSQKKKQPPTKTIRIETYFARMFSRF